MCPLAPFQTAYLNPPISMDKMLRMWDYDAKQTCVSLSKQLKKLSFFKTNPNNINALKKDLSVARKKWKAFKISPCSLAISLLLMPNYVMKKFEISPLF